MVELRRSLDGRSLTIDERAHRVTLGGRPINLTRTEYSLLVLLAGNPGVTLPRDLILDHIWGDGWFGSDHVLDVHVSNIRRKLGDGSGLISTVRGVGYRFETTRPIRWISTDTEQVGPAPRLELFDDDAQARAAARVDKAIEVVSLIGFEGQVTWISRSVELALGWHPQQLISQPLDLLFHQGSPAVNNESVVTELAGTCIPLVLATADGQGRETIAVNHALTRSVPAPSSADSGKSLDEPEAFGEVPIGLLCEWWFLEPGSAMDPYHFGKPSRIAIAELLS